MAFTPPSEISFKFTGKNPALSSAYTYDQLAGFLDASPEEVRQALITLIDELESTGDGSSGADNIGATEIADLNGETIQAILESLRDNLKSETDSSSGADFIALTAIADLTGSSVQAVLESLKAYVDAYKSTVDGFAVKLTGNQTVAGTKTFSSSPIVPAPTENNHAPTKSYVDTKDSNQTTALSNHKASADHDGRYYTVSESDALLNTKANDSAVVKLSGAQTIAGAKTFSDSPIVPTPTANMQTATKKYVDDTIVSISVPDGSLGDVKLSNEEGQIKDRVNIIEADLPESPPTLTTLSHGTNLITAGRSALASAKIHGRTLVNLLGRDGRFANGTTNWTTSNVTGFTASNGIGSFTATAQYGRILRNINATENHKYYVRGEIDSDSSSVRLYLTMASGVTVLNVYHSGVDSEVLSGIGQAPSSGISSPYVAIADDRASGWTQVQATKVGLYDLTDMFGEGNEPEKEWCDANIPYVDSVQHLTGAYVQNETNGSYLYINDSLGDGEAFENGVKNKIWERKVLDGSLPWTYFSPSTGLKTITITDQITNHQNFVGNCVKYDGKILQGRVDGTFTLPDNYQLSNGDVFISIPNTDSGWGDSYTPTEDEIKAYFNGWVVFSEPGGLLWDGSTGTKAWGKRYCGIGTPIDKHGVSVISGSGTTTLPTTINDQGYTPYELHYKLATPVSNVPVQTEGSLYMSEGENTLTLGEAVVVREVAITGFNPANSIHYINDTTPLIYSPLKFKAEKLLEIYKNRIPDIHNWTIVTHGAPNGKERAFIPTANFDPSATYTVTYLAEPYQLSASALEAELTYGENLGTVVQEVVEKTSNVETRLSLGEEYVDILRNMIDKQTGELSTLTNTVLGSGTAISGTTGTLSVTMDGSIKTLTPTGNVTLNATGGVLGQEVTFKFIQDSATTRTITFGTNFKSQGNLSLGATASRAFSITFIYDGTYWIERYRSGAIVL